MKNLKILLITVSAILCFIACEKNESTNLLTISGEVFIENALIPEIKTPLEGITVYLLNSPYSVDTISWWVTQTDILDSTQTDSKGVYEFKNLQVGNYVVLPNDPIVNYQFDWSESPDSNTISVESAQTAYTINFAVPEILAKNSPGTYTFEINNITTDTYTYNFSLYRKERSRIIWWSDWNWKRIDGYNTDDFPDKWSYTAKQTDTYFHEYNDEFMFGFSSADWEGDDPDVKFYNDYVLNIADLKVISKFNLLWDRDQNHVIVSPVE